MSVRRTQSDTTTNGSAASAARTASASGMLTAGFVLFVITLVVNTVAAIIVNRSRSGAGTDA